MAVLLSSCFNPRARILAKQKQGTQHGLLDEDSLPYMPASSGAPSGSTDANNQSQPKTKTNLGIPSASTPDVRYANNNNGMTIATSSANGSALPSGGIQNSALSLQTSDSISAISEVDTLRNEVHTLQRELTRCREVINKLQEKEKALKDRLSEQAQKQLEKGSKFEDLSLGENRPSQLIRRYDNLYSQTRLDAFDALDELPEMAEFDDLKGKLLFSVIVLAFRSAQQYQKHLRQKIRHMLCIPENKNAMGIDAQASLVKEMEDMVTLYLRKTVERFDISMCSEEVCSQVYATLYDYPSLKQCAALRNYIEESVRIAWSLVSQNPPLFIDFEGGEFNPEHHTRFHTSDPDSNQIKSVLWPALTEGENGPCVQKGMVIT